MSMQASTLVCSPPPAALRAQLALAVGLLDAPRRWWGARPGDSDWALWQRACSGDPGSARALVQLLTPPALAMARHMLGRLEDAEDAVQESFLRLWSARPEDTHGAKLSTYFNTIVLNRCRTQLVRRRELGLEPDVLTALQDAQQAAIGAGESPASVAPHQLLQALAQLPARQRMALAMWAYADASAADIGRALEIDANGAHQLLHRAKTNLRLAWRGDAA
ncbi:sigma-70 family RNA polymerase sigma factor [Hydrogenophaga sp. 2FB]|uniref:RNA polymerase sigma factor n=1 Tax=Hydrogenophaga sp. 2FB TaxID=2502187 RepID=UPI0010F49206|nr:sigma-70 family RNA polymerase sigma factor [Hydrogenophaga sp. 2FB]